jgi:hypothetical protein
MKYIVMVDDNFHYMDESHRYEFGRFNSLNKAKKAAMKIVDDFLIENKDKVADEGELIAMYCLYGEDPFILNDDKENYFSARTYASQRCKELFEK